MRFSRSISARRAILTSFVASVGFIAACDTTAGFRPDEVFWGFITLRGLEVSGAQRLEPTALFFRGTVSQLPSSALKPDSCFGTQAFVPPANSFTNVTFLDAGAALSVQLGSQLSQLPRTLDGTGKTVYALPSPGTFAYAPGDSFNVSVPGAPGGFPQAAVRARTAEAFVLDPVTINLAAPLQLRWNAAADTNSAMILSLRWTPAGGGANFTQEIRCAYRDDGRDSIKVAQFSAWADTTNIRRTIAATRLRTSAVPMAQGGALQVISTFEYPRPIQ